MNPELILPLGFNDRAELDRIEAEAERASFSWEVVLAENLLEASRERQLYHWLGVDAADQLGALGRAEEWVWNERPDLELTDMVRRAGPHYIERGRLLEGTPMPVNWQVPLPRNLRPGQIVYHPANGRRVGFVAFEPERLDWHPGPDDFLLLMAKPTEGRRPEAIVPNRPRCLCPIIDSIEISTN